MNQYELLDGLSGCTISQLKAIEAKCKDLIRKKRPNNGIESDILRIVERAPNFRIRLSELKRRMKNAYSAQEVQEAIDQMETIYGGYAVKLEPIADEPRRRYGRRPTSPDKIVFGWTMEPVTENT
jgi:hypothetical protein